MEKWKKLKSELILNTKFFKARKDLVELPNGKTKEWTYWDSNDSVMVVGMISSSKKLVMIRQYRYLADNEVIEFPSGGIKDGENIKAAAKREFEEESGYSCKNLIKLGSFYETYGQLNRQIHIFFTSDLKKTKQKLDGGDEHEDIKVVLMEFDKVVLLALKNKIVAMGSTLAILLVKEKIKTS